jgi:hypothetical protein
VADTRFELLLTAAYNLVCSNFYTVTMRKGERFLPGVGLFDRAPRPASYLEGNNNSKRTRAVKSELMNAEAFGAPSSRN